MVHELMLLHQQLVTQELVLREQRDLHCRLLLVAAARAWDAPPVAAAHAWSLAAFHEVLAIGTLQESIYSGN
jgi:hypothetical protein